MVSVMALEGLKSDYRPAAFLLSKELFVLRCFLLFLSPPLSFFFSNPWLLSAVKVEHTAL